MTEAFPDDTDITTVELGWFRQFGRPCLLAGFALVAETGNPALADHSFVVEEHFELERAASRAGETTTPVTLHCASKALLKCHADVAAIMENPLQTGRSPRTATFDQRTLGKLACPYREQLEQLGRIIPTAAPDSHGTDT